MSVRYFDDFKLGEKFITASVTFTEAMIVEFARDYDPQTFHIDPEAAKHSIYGSLIASEYQTMALGFRLVYDTGIFNASMVLPGVDDVHFIKPIRPGDVIHVEMEVVDLRLSGSDPDHGIMRGAYRYINQKGETVMTCIAMHQLRRRKG